MKKKYFIFLLFPIICLGQTQIGENISGESPNDYFGYCVSLSSDGTTMAIGAPFNDGNGSNTGHVRVYKNILNAWTQIGSDINGEAAFDYSGSSISLSPDGTVVAIGAVGNDGNGDLSGHVRVYKNVSGEWLQQGSDIDGESAGDYSGFSVSLSSDGAFLAIGAPFNDVNGYISGDVRVFKNVSGMWSQIGSKIIGEAADDDSGFCVSLSSDGSVVAISSIYNDGNGTDSGHVRIFRNVSGVWSQVGSDIDGEAAYDYSGYSISLSSDGTIVAIASINTNESPTIYSGHVRVFKNVFGSWMQVGATINGEVTSNNSKTLVSLSSDGSILAVGTLYDNVDGIANGHVRVYRNISDGWDTIASDIVGEFGIDSFGTSVSLSSDGSKLAVGAPHSVENLANFDAGYARVYDLSTVLSINDFDLCNFSVYPNPVTDKLTLDLKENIALENVTIYNTLGQVVSTQKAPVIDVSSLSKGNYIIEVMTNKGKALKKIIVR